jgi:hypothetical protein
MLFKDSWAVTSVNGAILTFDQEVSCSSGDWLYSDEQLYKVSTIDQTKKIVTLT